MSIKNVNDLYVIPRRKATISVHIILTYVMMGIIFLGLMYLVLKYMNMNKKITRLNEFVHGDVFSDNFHHGVSQYFADKDNTKLYLLDPLMPVIQNVVQQAIKYQIKELTQRPKIWPEFGDDERKPQKSEAELIQISDDIFLFS